MESRGLDMILASLLEALESIGERHPELHDTDVRERMSESIWRGFVQLQPGYALPDDFGMFTPEGNREVRTALSIFLAEVRRAWLGAGLGSSAQRLRAFQNRKVTTHTGRNYDSFFGTIEPAASE